MTSFKMLFGTIVKVLSAGIREMGYLGMLCVCVWVYKRGSEGTLLVMLYRDKASIITLLEKQSERDKHWNIVSWETWSIWRNGAALFQFNTATPIRFRLRTNSRMIQPSQMCLQLGTLKCFQYRFSICVFVSHRVGEANSDFCCSKSR